jgi:hypothetical protein
MPKGNKYLGDFLNLLNDDQVFHTYLSNTFMLNQMNSLFSEIRNGSRDKEEVERDILDIMRSVEIIAPDLIGMMHVNVTSEEFHRLLKTVKQQTIENLVERRQN